MCATALAVLAEMLVGDEAAGPKMRLTGQLVALLTVCAVRGVGRNTDRASEADIARLGVRGKRGRTGGRGREGSGRNWRSGWRMWGDQFPAAKRHVDAAAARVGRPTARPAAFPLFGTARGTLRTHQVTLPDARAAARAEHNPLRRLVYVLTRRASRNPPPR